MKLWNCEALTGGGTRALDSISVASLTDGDIAITMVSGALYCHKFNATGTAAENSPAVVRPNDYLTAGNWEQQSVGDVYGRGTTPSGVTLTGEVSGFDFEHGTDSDHDIDINPGSCMDSTNAAVISRTTSLTIALDGAGLLNGTIAASTVYHVYLLLKDSDSTVAAGFLADGDTLATYLPSGYSKYRWIGFVRTNSSSNICAFVMADDHISFSIASENVVSTGITTTYAVVDHSSFMPESRIKCIEYGARDSSNNSDSIFASDDGTNVSFIAGLPNATASDTDEAVWGGGADQKASLKPYFAAREFKSSGGTLDLLIHSVILKR